MRKRSALPRSAPSEGDECSGHWHVLLPGRAGAETWPSHLTGACGMMHPARDGLPRGRANPRPRWHFRNAVRRFDTVGPVPFRPKSKRDPTMTGENTHFPIVGIGASAGGIPAMEGLFKRHAATDPGAAFVIVTHLSPDRESLLHDVVGRYTDLPVQVAEDGLRGRA